MTGRFVRIALPCLLLLVIAAPSDAARRSSLAGNLLIQDMDDVFFFPQNVVNYNRTVTFDFGTNADLGSGGMIFGGERLTFGAFAHRGDFMGAIPSAFSTRGDIDNILDDGSESAPVGPDALNWIDVLMGWQLGENPWGIRLSVGHGSNDPAAAAVSSSSTGINAVVGAKLVRWNIDASIEFTYLTSEDNIATQTEESSPIAVAVAARHLPGEEGDALGLGWLGEFHYDDGSIDRTPIPAAMGTTDDFNGMSFIGGLGPVYRPSARTNVAMYGTFEYLSNEDKVGTVTTTETHMVIPGWHIGAEVEIASWLQARAGLVSRYTFHTDKTENSMPVSESEIKDVFLEYQWTSGVGIHFDNFTVDGYLDPSVLTNGTSVFGSNGNRLFGLVTASYAF